MFLTLRNDNNQLIIDFWIKLFAPDSFFIWTTPCFQLKVRFLRFPINIIHKKRVLPESGPELTVFQNINGDRFVIPVRIQRRIVRSPHPTPPHPQTKRPTKRPNTAPRRGRRGAGGGAGGGGRGGKVYGAKYLVPRIWYQVLGTRYLDDGRWMMDDDGR